MRTIFEGIRNMPIRTYARLVLKLNSFLKDMGFERVNYTQRLNLNTFYNKSTLMICPSLDLQDDAAEGENYIITTKVVNSYSSDWKLVGDYLSGRKGYYGMNNYKYVVRTKEEVIPINAKTKNGESIRIGDYFKERNIVALYINIFNSDLADSDNEMIFPILEDLKKELEGKVNKIDVSDKMKLSMLNTFRKEIEEKITEVEVGLSGNERNLQERRRDLIRLIKNLQVSKKEVECLKLFSLNVDTTLKAQIDELKKLSFVKNIRLTTKGIKMSLGRIYINYKGIDIYMGEYTLTITPDNVKVECLNPVVKKEEIFIHPHINDGNNCYGGERSLKIEEYLSCFELKKLVYFVYLFLKSYNVDDCFHNIRLWEGRPKRLKKVKEEVERDFEDNFVGDDTGEMRNNSDEDEDEDEDNQDTCPDCGNPYDDCICENPNN